MNTCSATPITGKLPPCEPEKKIVRQGQPGSKLKIAKIVHNYKQKTQEQIKDAVQMEIDHALVNNPGYRFVDSKMHFNKTGGIDMMLNFEKK